GIDPMISVLAMPSAEQAVRYLRSEEARRVEEIRSIVVTSVNNVPIRIDDLVQGGPVINPGSPSSQGVVVAHQTRLGRVSIDRSDDPARSDWDRVSEVVQGIVLMRKNE